jgi:carboxyl-terminal processing protease
MDEVLQRHSNGELLFADSNKIMNGKSFVTACRDSVYGGDGIMPNFFVPIDTTFYGLQMNGLVAGNSLNSYIYNYYLQHKQQMEQYSSPADYVQRFNATELWDGLIKYPGDSIDLTKANSQEKELLQQRLKALLARFKWRNEGFYQVLNSNDPSIKKAMELMK